VVLDQPVDAIRFAAFLVRREREDDVAIGTEAFAVQAQERFHQDSVGLLHVLGAAAVVVAVFGYKLEGVGGPVAAACFDDIEVADEQEWAFCRLRRDSAPPGSVCGRWGRAVAGPRPGSPRPGIAAAWLWRLR